MSVGQEAQRYRGMAAAIADTLCREALWHEDRCNWGGAAIEPLDGEWTTLWRTCGPSIYDGTAGIGLFFARLYELTRDPKHAEHAVAALRQACSVATSSMAALSFHAGTLGVAFAAQTVARICGRPELASEASPLMHAAMAADPMEQGSDVISGLAGAIPALLALARVSRSGDGLRDLAVRCGDALIEQARQHADGSWSWPMHQGSPESAGGSSDLVGYSHGTAGIACGFLELWKEIGEARFSDAASHAHSYERRWYSASERNWPDLRSFGEAKPGEAPGYPAYWCHGAAGIAVARLRAHALTSDPQLRAEGEIAIETTLRQLELALNPSGGGFAANFSLCHGLAGSAETLLYGADKLPEKAATLRARAQQVAELGIGRHGAGGPHAPGPWPCGVFGGGETPGLMLGTAGIGYFYLRAAEPRVPTPLLVEPEVA